MKVSLWSNPRLLLVQYCVFKVTRGKVSSLLLGWFIHIYWTPASCTSDFLRSRYLLSRRQTSNMTLYSKGDALSAEKGWMAFPMKLRHSVRPLWTTSAFQFYPHLKEEVGPTTSGISFRHVGYWVLWLAPPQTKVGDILFIKTHAQLNSKPQKRYSRIKGVYGSCFHLLLYRT